MKKFMFLLAVVSLATFAAAQITGQGATVLNGGITENWSNIAPGAGPNNNGGPGLGRHALWSAGGNALGCETCHLPHTAPVYGSSFLWAWKTTPTNVTTYITDTNVGGALVTPTGRTANTRSMLCLTCHDATSASSNGITASIAQAGLPFALLNTAGGTGSLGGQHPVDALVPVNSDYAPVVPVTATLSQSADSVSGQIGANMLPLWGSDYRVECSSCHDQHNDYTADNGVNGGYPFLRVANTNGTTLCRECHNK